MIKSDPPRTQEGAPIRAMHPLFICLIIITLISCSSEDSNTSNQVIELPTPVNLETILEQVGNSMSNLQSFEFYLYHRNGDGSPLEGLILTEAIGLVEKPSNVSVEADLLLGNLLVKSGIIYIGDNSFILNPLTKTWETLDSEIGLLNFFSPETGIESILASFSNPVLIMENNESLTIKGIVPATSLSSIVGETTNNNVTAEITILKKTHLMIKAKISGRLTNLDSEGLVRFIEISKFNQTFNIAVPPES